MEEPEQCLKVMPVGNCGAGTVIKPCGTRECVPCLYFSTHSEVCTGFKGVVMAKLPARSTFWPQLHRDVDGRARVVCKGDASGQLQGGKRHKPLRNPRSSPLSVFLNTFCSSLGFKGCGFVQGASWKHLLVHSQKTG